MDAGLVEDKWYLGCLDQASRWGRAEFVKIEKLFTWINNAPFHLIIDCLNCLNCGIHSYGSGGL